MRKEVQLCKDIGRNGLRTHIKIDVPRKLYWADKLGLLVMADLPNSWGEPDEEMQAESERTLREMIKRDFNHPTIFSWVVFNETWGLFTNTAAEGEKQKREYLPKTQNLVAFMYCLTKSLDETGNYGYLVKVPLTTSQLKSLGKTGSLKVKIESFNGGGIVCLREVFRALRL